MEGKESRPEFKHAPPAICTFSIRCKVPRLINVPCLTRQQGTCGSHATSHDPGVDKAFLTAGQLHI